MNYLHLKAEFRMVLRPMMDLFEFKRSILSSHDWVDYVTKTKLRIVTEPHQFLGKELPEAGVISEIVESIFSDYLNEEDIAVV